MKIGIMSMQRIINYGSFLQAYGLKKIVESLGNEVEFVDYKHEPPVQDNVSAILSHPSSKIAMALKFLFSPRYRKKRYADIKQNKSYKEFYDIFKEEWLPYLGIDQEQILTPQLDVLVIGSDEVFNCTLNDANVGYSLQLFGKDNNAKKVITYAASFGSTTLEKLQYYKKIDEIAGLLSKIDSISTRDSNSHFIVKELTGVDAVNNVDPVLVYDFDKESNYEVNLYGYVVVYAYSGRISDKEADAIQKFAHSKGLKTLSIGVMQAFTDEYIFADPFELLAYIKKASYVVTDTFHGAVFAIKYQVPFAVFIRDSNKEKLTDLLEKYNLNNRIVSSIKDLESVITRKLNPNLSELKERYKHEAVEYLSNNLKL